jgi:hypothetical protein
MTDLELMHFECSMAGLLMPVQLAIRLCFDSRRGKAFGTLDKLRCQHFRTHDPAKHRKVLL